MQVPSTPSPSLRPSLPNIPWRTSASRVRSMPMETLISMPQFALPPAAEQEVPRILISRGTGTALDPFILTSSPRVDSAIGSDM